MPDETDNNAAPPDARKPWDRLEDETPEAFIAFAFYRDMPPPRSIRKAYKQYSPGATTSGSWFNWSSRFRWKERLAAFDSWLAKERTAAVVASNQSEAHRLAENQRRFRDNECHLSDLALKRARDILRMPVAQDSWVEQRDGKTIIHKATLISPSHLLAAAALMRAGSDIGRKGHGLKDEGDGDSITVEQFRRLFYRNTGEIAHDLPAGALPVPVENPAVKPVFALPSPSDALPGVTANVEASPAAEGTNGHASGNGHANGNGHALPAAAKLPGEIVKFRPHRERP
jgi:hypothetical protein